MAHSDAMKALLQAAGTEGFALSACRACGHTFYPPQSFCPACLDPDVEARPDPGRATVLSITRLHRTLDPALAGRLPLHVACVKIPQGPSMFAMAGTLLAPGAKVRLLVRDGLIHAEPEE